MKVNILKTLFLFMILIGVALNSNEVSAKMDARVLSEQNLSDTILSDEELVNNALNGELINTKHTSTKVVETQNKMVVEIDKELSKQILSNGIEVYSGEKIVTTIFQDSIEDTPSPLGPISILSSGSKTEDDSPLGSTVSVTVKINYDYIYKDGSKAYKMTSYALTPKSLDNQFSLTSITHEARSNGAGYLSDGTSYSKLESTGVLSVNYPVSGNAINKTLSGWKKYVVPGLTDGVGAGVNGVLKYKRNSGTSTQSFNYAVSL